MSKLLTILLLTNAVLASGNDGLEEVSDRRLNEITARISLYNETGQILKKCTGVLVKKDLILTARHCIQNIYSAMVTIGQGEETEMIYASRFSVLDKRSDEPLEIEDFRNLKDDDKKIISSDIGVIHLSAESKNTPLKIRTPDKSIDLSKQALFMTGFPDRSIRTVAGPSWLGGESMRLATNVKSLTTCSLKFSENWLKDSFLTTNCIATSGNSGGPLLTYIEDELYLLAIASSGFFEGEDIDTFLRGENVTSFYVNIHYPKVNNWLTSLLRED